MSVSLSPFLNVITGTENRNSQTSLNWNLDGPFQNVDNVAQHCEIHSKDFLKENVHNYGKKTRLNRNMNHSKYFFRQEYMFREVSKLSTKLPNLRVMKTRFSTIWGGASLLTMLLAAMKELLEMSDWTDWDFVLNLSESDYPVKTQKELVEFLTNNRHFVFDLSSTDNDLPLAERATL